MPWKPMWLASLILLVSSCANGLETRVPVRDFCLLYKPVLVSRLDFLTKGTAAQTLANNETWDRNCRRPQS